MESKRHVATVGITLEWITMPNDQYGHAQLSEDWEYGA